MLIGLKGSGKTYIGSLLEKETHIIFLRVEAVWLNLQDGDDGWRQVEAAIDMAFRHGDKVMVEHLGIGNEFHRYREKMGRKYQLRMIQVTADPLLCLERVRCREAGLHIPVSDEQVSEYNRLASGVKFDWDLTIDNSGPATREEILSAFTAL